MKKTGNCISIALLILFTVINGMAQRRGHPVGTIRVSTEVPGNLDIDNKPVKKMTICHYVVISGIDTGNHTLSIRHDSTVIQKKIHVVQGYTDQYIIKPDSVVYSSTQQGKIIRGSEMKIRSSYIPKTKGLFYLARVGYSSGKESNYFNGKIVVGYDFSPMISLGIGTGFVKNYSTFHYDHITNVYLLSDWGHEKMTSSGFSVPFLPVFVTFRSSLLKKRVVPYLSLDIGLSIPLIQKIDGEYSVSEDGGYPFPHPFQVRNINAGLYIGINPGLKCYLYSKYYLDLSMGGDICVNKFIGNIPDGKSSVVKSTSNFHMTVGFGF